MYMYYDQGGLPGVNTVGCILDLILHSLSLLHLHFFKYNNILQYYSEQAIAHTVTKSRPTVIFCREMVDLTWLFKVIGIYYLAHTCILNYSL